MTHNKLKLLCDYGWDCKSEEIVKAAWTVVATVLLNLDAVLMKG